MRVTTSVFIEKQEKLSLNYPQYPLLSEALISSVTGLLHNRIMTPNIQEYLSLNTEAVIHNPPLVCTCTSSKYRYQPAGNIITGDPSIVENKNLREFLSKGPKYRILKLFSWKQNSR